MFELVNKQFLLSSNATTTEFIDLTNKPIIKLLISSFIAHGFLDYITLFPNFANNLSWYFTAALLSFISMVYYPTIGISIFIGTSMYHFGEDFRFLFEKHKKKSYSARWGGAILFASSVFVDWNIWVSTIQWLNISNPKLLTASVLAMGIPALFNICSHPVSIIIPTIIGGLGGVNPGLILYSCCIHTPLAIYRYLKDNVFSFKKKCVCVIVWVGGTIVVFFGMDYLGKLTPLIFNVGIGIVVTHVIFITKWQLLGNVNKKKLFII